MQSYALSIRRWGWVLAVLIPLAGCNQGPSPEVRAQLDSLETARDSLSQQLAERTETIERLSRTIEEAAADVEGGVSSPEELRDRITGMADELATAREQLEETRRRIQAVSSRSSRLRDSLNTVITVRDEALAVQRDSIATLVGTLDAMSTRIEELSAERVELNDALATLEDRYYTAYLAIGTQEELLEQGIIEKEGGARVLLILWKAGETLVPARDLNAEQFEAIDVREMSTIELPEPGSYRLVSRHNPDYLDAAIDEDGRFQAESLRITEPSQFWRTSRYLILMRED